jgi:hypothetical protein
VTVEHQVDSSHIEIAARDRARTGRGARAGIDPLAPPSAIVQLGIMRSRERLAAAAVLAAGYAPVGRG